MIDVDGTERTHSEAEFYAFRAWVEKTFGLLSGQRLALSFWTFGEVDAVIGGRHWWELGFYQDYAEAGYPSSDEPVPELMSYDDLVASNALPAEKFGIIAKKYPDKLYGWLKGNDEAIAWLASLESVFGLIELPGGKYWNNSPDNGPIGLIDPEAAQVIIDKARGEEEPKVVDTKIVSIGGYDYEINYDADGKEISRNIIGKTPEPDEEKVVPEGYILHPAGYYTTPDGSAYIVDAGQLIPINQAYVDYLEAKLAKLVEEEAKTDRIEIETIGDYDYEVHYDKDGNVISRNIIGRTKEPDEEKLIPEGYKYNIAGYYTDPMAIFGKLMLGNLYPLTNRKLIF